MVKTLTYDNPDHKIKLKIQQFQVIGKSTGQINNIGYKATEFRSSISTFDSSKLMLLVVHMMLSCNYPTFFQVGDDQNLSLSLTIFSQSIDYLSSLFSLISLSLTIFPYLSLSLTIFPLSLTIFSLSLTIFSLSLTIFSLSFWLILVNFVNFGFFG